jgi:hypothetical protein
MAAEILNKVFQNGLCQSAIGWACQFSRHFGMRVGNVSKFPSIQSNNGIARRSVVIFVIGFHSSL